MGTSPLSNTSLPLPPEPTPSHPPTPEGEWSRRSAYPPSPPWFPLPFPALQICSSTVRAAFPPGRRATAGNLAVSRPPLLQFNMRGGGDRKRTKRHIPPHPAQPRYTNYWAPRTRKRHQQEHRPQWPTERSDPTRHAKGRTGDCPGPRKETTTRRNVTRGGAGLSSPFDSMNPLKMAKWTVTSFCDACVVPCEVRGSRGSKTTSRRVALPHAQRNAFATA